MEAIVDWTQLASGVVGGVISIVLVAAATFLSKKVRGSLHLVLHEALRDEDKHTLALSSSELHDLLEALLPSLADDPESLLDSPEVRGLLVSHLPYLIEVVVALAALHRRQL